MFPLLNLLHDVNSTINTTFTGFLTTPPPAPAVPITIYALCTADKAIYIDYYLGELVRHILDSEAAKQPKGIFASTGLYSQEHCDAVWDFVVLVMMHELCHWARNNEQHFRKGAPFAPFYDPSEFYDPNKSLAQSMSDGDFDLYPVFIQNGQIEHGLSWECAYYRRSVVYGDLDINPNVFAWYNYHLSGTRNPLTQNQIRTLLNGRFRPQNGLFFYMLNAKCCWCFDAYNRRK